jgi:hypothetical protein
VVEAQRLACDADVSPTARSTQAPSETVAVINVQLGLRKVLGEPVLRPAKCECGFRSERDPRQFAATTMICVDNAVKQVVGGVSDPLDPAQSLPATGMADCGEQPLCQMCNNSGPAGAGADQQFESTLAVLDVEVTNHSFS